VYDAVAVPAFVLLVYEGAGARLRALGPVTLVVHGVKPEPVYVMVCWHVTTVVVAARLIVSAPLMSVDSRLYTDTPPEQWVTYVPAG
jgi:hypothetical protein